MNWADEWRKLVLGSSLRKEGGSFASREFAEWYDRQLEHNDYPGVLLEKVRRHLDRNSTVLDIGGGTGAFAIPLAREVKEVTVVERSPEMLRCLRRKMEGLANIRSISRCWEDVTIEEIGIHDMVIAAHSLYDMEDIETALKKMLSAAKKHLYFIMGAGKSSFYADIWQHFKEEYHPPPSFIYAYNVLYQLGISADVEIIQAPRSQVYSGIEQAVKHWMVRLDLPSEREGELRAFLLNRLKQTPMGGCPPTNHENSDMDTVRGEPVEPPFDQLRANGMNLFSEQKEGLLCFEEKGQSAIIRYERK